jgi:hypothetical protein
MSRPAASDASDAGDQGRENVADTDADTGQRDDGDTRADGFGGSEIHCGSSFR